MENTFYHKNENFVYLVDSNCVGDEPHPHSCCTDIFIDILHTLRSLELFRVWTVVNIRGSVILA